LNFNSNDGIVEKMPKHEKKICDMTKIKKICIVMQGGLGDQVMISPTIEYIRKKEKNAHITVISRRDSSEYHEKNPNINRHIVAPLWQQYVENNEINYEKLKSLLGAAAVDSFDYLYNPHHGKDEMLSGIISTQIQAKRKIGFNQIESISDDYKPSLFYNEILPLPHLEHCALYQRVFTEREYGESFDCFDFKVYYTEFDEKYINRLVENQIYNDNIAVIHTGGGISPRKLSVEQLQNIASELLKKGMAPILVGNDLRNFEQVQCIDLTNKMSIGQSAYLILRSKLVICPDSGIKHLASANRKPICEISHIPMGLMHLNGPYVGEKHLYSAIQFWAPNPHCPHAIVYPEDGLFEANDIASGACITSISANLIVDTAMQLIA